MAKNIDSDAEITSIRLDEQTSAPSPDAGYSHIFAKADGLYIVDDDDVMTGPFGAGVASHAIAQGRLTLTSGTPVTTSEVSSATTLYFTPYKGNLVGLYDGSSAWSLEAFTERSLSLSGYTANKNYDIWLYDNSGTLTLASTVWTDNTTRATALAWQDGVYVKSGATNYRYLGTIRINSSGGQCDDSLTKRFCWNYYNQKNRRLDVKDQTVHTYGSTTVRAWNNDTTIRVEMVIGVHEDTSSFSIIGQATSNYPNIAIGFDTTIALSLCHWYHDNTVSNVIMASVDAYDIPIGYHYAQVVQSSDSGTCTFAKAYLDITIMG